MPKQVLSAAEILGAAAPAAEEQVPVVPQPDPAALPEEKPEQQAGFETPAPETVEPLPAEEPASAEVPAPVTAAAILAPQMPESLASQPQGNIPTKEEIARLEYEQGAAAARAGEELPEGASDDFKIGYASITPPKETEGVEKQWRFVKNVHPNEIITFSDGTTYKFPGASLITSDPELAEKLIEVGDLHHICLQ